MKNCEIFTALAKPFDSSEIHFKDLRGKRMAYITARSVMNRLDEVVGPPGWQAEHKVLTEGSRGNTYYAIAECSLTIKLGEETIVRRDIGGASNPDPLVALKGAVSDSLKRAAVWMGVGRHLYGDGVPEYDHAETEDIDSNPLDPEVEIDFEERQKTLKDRAEQTKQRGQNNKFALDRMPTSGKSLWAWCKAWEETGSEWAKGLAYRVKGHFAKQNYPADLADWTIQHVTEACRYVDTLKQWPEPAKPKVTRRSAIKAEPIVYNEAGLRLSPLTMNEQVTEPEFRDAEVKLAQLATTAGLPSSLDFAAAICRAAAQDNKAPYLKGMEIDLREGIRHYALLKKHFPEWLQPAVRAAVNQFRLNHQGGAA